MARIFFKLFTLPFLLAISFGCDSDKQMILSKNGINNFNQLIEGFENTPIDYSTAPFWVWNDKVSKEKIDRQLPLFKEQGISQVFIHPRPGLITEYLSDEWFELIQYSVELGKKLDMKVWLYDENSYPSGFAGGHVLSVMPPSFDPVVGLKLDKLEVLTIEDVEKYFVIIKKINNQFANISSGASRYVNQPGEYYCYSKWYYPTGEGWFGGSSYVDLLAYGITERFIKSTMSGYEEYMGEDFGNTIPGIFTDEPNISTQGGDHTVIRYTPILFKKFKDLYGYQLENYLPCLYEEIGDWKNVRHDYQSLLLDMFIDRWSVPWYEYTEKHNLKWTGHYWEHGWPNPKHGGDNMAMYAWHQIPGIDMLFNDEEGRPDQFGNIRAVKELSSVVNQLGKERALSETYGGSGWELTFEDMKRLGDWEYALGVNFINQHLSFMTIKGSRKRDYPQSMSYHTPWWDNYKPLNTYFEKLSFALSSGSQINRILVIEPTTTTWMYYSPFSTIDAVQINRASFHEFLKKLENLQVEYDLGSERIIRDHGKILDQKFAVGERNYDMVILPPKFENIQLRTYNLLIQYLNKGGKVISFSEPPTHLDGNLSRKISTELGKYKDQWTVLSGIDKKMAEEYLGEEDFNPVLPEEWTGNIFHQRRKFTDGQIIFLANFDSSVYGNFAFEIKGMSAVAMDPFSGNYFKFPTKASDGYVTIEYNLPPAGSLLLFVSNSDVNAPDAIRYTEDEKHILSAETSVSSLSSNMITLDYCDLFIDSRSFKDIYFYQAAEEIFKTYLKEPYGANYNPWSTAVQYRTNILDKNTFDESTGFKASFPFFIDSDILPAELEAVIERPQLYEVYINDVRVQPTESKWWLDDSFGVFNIAGNIHKGKNVITLVAPRMDIHAELEPVYLTGNFGVANSQTGWKLTELPALDIGSWKDQLRPFYSGSVRYQKIFDLENINNRRYKVKLNAWQGSVTEIKVNDIKAGIIAWQPYELDITESLKTGNNKVEVIVTGSLKNLLGPHHKNPTEGFVTPWSFFKADQHQPPGNKYHLLDYGLLEDFEIIQY